MKSPFIIFTTIIIVVNFISCKLMKVCPYRCEFAPFPIDGFRISSDMPGCRSSIFLWPLDMSIQDISDKKYLGDRAGLTIHDICIM